MDAISMYDRGSWSSRPDTLRSVVALVVTVGLGLVPVALLLVVVL